VLKQSLQQKQQLRMTPQQMLVQKLIALPVISLEQRIKEEIESNPALEEVPENEPEAREEQDALTDGAEGEASDGILGDEAADFMEESDEYVPAYKTSLAYDADSEKEQKPVAATVSFQDSLMFQLGMRNLNERQYLLAGYIIGNIDDDGYLRRDLYSIANDITFLQNIQTDEQELQPLLEMVQELDPPGIGARNLQECLLIQLRRKAIKAPATELALKIVNRAFDEFTKKNYARIKEMLHTDDEKLKAALDEILKLNPKPGDAYSEEGAAVTVIPDFTVTLENGEPELTLNYKNTGRLRVSTVYSEMTSHRSKKGKQEREAASFARRKMEAANSFMDALKQREDTLQKVMQAILDYQRNYFREGDESLLKPMLLKNIAAVTHLDISTISRVVNSKYVQTAFGTLLLKNLFSESFRKESGEEVSVKTVKNLLRELIEAENKKSPLNDDALVDMLKEKGCQVARRTVAKYREQLDIPVARLRKAL
jgi:RNA polymerase sigma-54 factor